MAAKRVLIRRVVHPNHCFLTVAQIFGQCGVLEALMAMGPLLRAMFHLPNNETCMSNSRVCIVVLKQHLNVPLVRSSASA